MNLKITFFVLLLSTLGLTTAFGQHLEAGYGSDSFNSVANTLTLSQPYPNPASHSATVRYDLGTSQEGKIQVYNLLGTRVKSYRLARTSGKATVPVHELKSGLYFLRLEVNGKETLMVKLKVMH